MTELALKLAEEVNFCFVHLVKFYLWAYALDDWISSKAIIPLLFPKVICIYFLCFFLVCETCLIYLNIIQFYQFYQ